MKKYIYHYTTVETLFNILHNIDNWGIKLRAYYFMNMNDPNDCRYLINTVSSVLSKRQNVSGDNLRLQIELAASKNGIPYFISFSSAKDNLTMWDMYGQNGHGVSICFDMREVLDAVENFQNSGNKNQRSISKKCFCKLYECKYWNKNRITKDFIEKYNIRYNLSSKIIEGMNNAEICATSCLVKSPCYKHEKEIRAVFLYELDSALGPQYIELNLPIKAIKYIICGPCIDLSFVESVIPKGLDIKVFKSEVPFTDKPKKNLPFFFQ